MKRDVIIIGAGAAGLMCAIEAGKRGRSVLVLDHANKAGKKILISGGGRCNFTNLHITPAAYISSNEHFCKSALARFTPQEFLKLLEKYEIPYREKKPGQLFCESSAKNLVAALLAQCREHQVEILFECSVLQVSKDPEFSLDTSLGRFTASSLVVATGGLSVPKMGATGLGYDIAAKFGVEVTAIKPGLVPFTLEHELLKVTGDLSGISLDVEVNCGSACFRENMLFTHRGISGPAILQISSYWDEGKSVLVNLLPGIKLQELLADHESSEVEVKTLLCQYLPKRFLKAVFDNWLKNKKISGLTKLEKEELTRFFHAWRIVPKGTEGYRVAEVTVGGVGVHEISSKTFECAKAPGLFFIGEVLDVTGWLGGYNLQWAWSSGYCAGQFV